MWVLRSNNKRLTCPLGNWKNLVIEFVCFIVCHLVVDRGIHIVGTLKLHPETDSALVLCRDDVDTLWTNWYFEQEKKFELTLYLKKKRKKGGLKKLSNMYIPREVCNRHCRSKQLSGSPFQRVTGTSNAATVALLRTTTNTSTISPIAGNGGIA